MKRLESAIFIGYLFFFLFLIWKLRVFEIPGFQRWLSPLLFLFKVALGFGVWGLYFYYYGNDRISSDTFRFFDDALILYRSVFDSPSVYFQIITGVIWDAESTQVVIDQMNNWYKTHNYGVFNDNQTIIRWNALVLLFSFGNYFVHILFMNFFSLLGSVYLFKFFQSNSSLKGWLILASVFFFPQLVFWSSGVLKEGLVVLGLGLLIYGIDRAVVRILNTPLIIGLLILMITKNYILAAMLMPGAFFWFWKRYPHSTKWKIASLLYGSAVVGGLVTQWLLDVSVMSSFIIKQMDFIRLGLMTGAGSFFEIPILKPNMWSFISSAPIALGNAFFRPLWEDCNSMPMYLAWIENIAVAGIVLAGLVTMRKSNSNWNLFWLGLTFAITLFLVIGWVTPVAGALVRYKAPAIPFLIVAVLSISRIKWIHEA